MTQTLLASIGSDVVEAPGRTITGTALLFETPGTASTGRTVFRAGSLRLPDDIGRVKLFLDHDASDPVGYATAATVEGNRLLVTFSVAPGERGDLALSHASGRLRDGLSVGAAIEDHEFDGQTLIVKSALLHEVSLVSIPAFDDARVATVKAQRIEDIMTQEDTQSLAPDAESPAVEHVQAAAVPSAVPAAPAPLIPPIRTQPPAVAKFGLGTVLNMIQDSVKAGDTRSIQAALADITPTSIGTKAIGEGPHAPAYVGELWEAAMTERPIIDAVGKTDLTSLKMYGFKWETRPQVGRYAGEKAEVPTNVPKRVRAEWDAQRFAGGWDVDRVFFDLPGGTDFLRDVLVEATKSYMEQSEAYVTERLIAESTTTALPAQTMSWLPEVLVRVGTDFGAVRGSSIGLVQVAPDVWPGFLRMREDERPWWLTGSDVSITGLAGNVGGIGFSVNHALAPGTVLALDKRAVKIQEVDPPVKVQALDIAHGGIDLGVYGYIAAGVTDKRAVRLYTTAK